MKQRERERERERKRRGGLIKRELSLGEEFLKKKVKVRGEGKGICIINDRSNPSLRTVFPFPRRRIPIKIIKNNENTTTS